MWKLIKTLVVNLYLKLKCSMCCKSNCSVEVGRPTEVDEEEDKEQ